MKNCKACGMEMDDIEQKCPNCGAEQTAQQDNSEITVKKPKMDVVAIVGFAVSVITAGILIGMLVNMSISNRLGMAVLIIVSILILGIPTLVSLILNVIGLITSLKLKHRGKVFAIVGLSLTVLVVIVFFIFISTYTPPQTQALI